MRLLLVLLLAAACTPAPPVATTASPTPTVAARTAGPTPTVAVTTAGPTPTVAATAPQTAFPTVTAAAPTFRPEQPPVAECRPEDGGDQGVNRAPLTMRAAGHAGYDRVVIDFGPGSIPPFVVERVDRIRYHGSGFPIAMQGSVFIRVHWPAAGGAGEYPGPRRLLPDTEVVREVVFEEFEGATTVGIGLSRLVCPSLSTQSGGRLVLDFQY